MGQVEADDSPFTQLGFIVRFVDNTDDLLRGEYLNCTASLGAIYQPSRPFSP